MNSDSTTIAVLGGGGRTGNFVVYELLRRGYFVKLLIRHPETFQICHPHIEITVGDALDAERIDSLVKDSDAIINTIGQRQGEPLVASQVTHHILDAMQKFSVHRYISVAGLNIDVPTDRKGSQTLMATEWMKANYPVIQEDRQRAYTLLAKSNVHWTLVRVPFIEFKEAVGKITVSLEDCLGSKITAGDIAKFVVRQLSDSTFENQSPFITNP